MNLFRILTDRGTGYCGARELHNATLLVWKVLTKAPPGRNPHNHGPLRTLPLDHPKRILCDYLQKKIFHTPEALEELALWLQEYNMERIHTGKYCFGITPMQTFLES